MFTTFVVIALMALCIGFVKVYHAWQGSRPIMFTLLILTVAYTGMLLGNTFFTHVPFPIPWFEQWATNDALADGPLGASNGIFFAVMLGIAFVMSSIFSFITKHMGKYLGKPSVYLTYVGIVFITFTLIAAPVGINLHAMNVDLMSPTKDAAGTLAAAAMDAGATAIVSTSKELEKPLAQRQQHKRKSR